MIRYVSLILLVVFLLNSCKKNEYFIPQDQFVDVLVDLHMADAISQNSMLEYANPAEKDKVFKAIIKWHGLEEEQFDSTMHYYALNSEEFAAIYEQVMERLLVFETKAKAGEFDKRDLFEAHLLISDYLPQDSILLDSVLREVWPNRREYNFPEDGTKSRISYEIQYGDTANFKALLLKANIHLFEDDCSLNPQITLHVDYSNDSVDKKQVSLIKDSIPYTYSIYMLICDTTKLMKVKGEILGHDSCALNKHALVKNLRLYELVDSGHMKLKKPEKIISVE